MAYSSVDATRIVAGKPVRADDILGLRNNQEDLNTRVTAVEGVIVKVQVFNETIHNLEFNGGSTITGFAYWRAPSAFTLTSATITQVTAGSAGTMEIDIQKGSSVSSMSTVFSTKPSLAYTAGNAATSSNAVFSSASVSANDFLRLDLTSIQTGIGTLIITIYGEVV